LGKFLNEVGWLTGAVAEQGGLSEILGNFMFKKKTDQNVEF
jgi:hypothetical protein